MTQGPSRYRKPVRKAPPAPGGRLPILLYGYRFVRLQARRVEH